MIEHVLACVRWLPVLAWVLWLPNYLGAGEAPKVLVSSESPMPAPQAKDVSPRTVVRVQFTAPVKSETVTAKTFRLLDDAGQVVPAQVNCDLTGGVATLTPLVQLRERHAYTVELQDAIIGQNGAKLVPYRWSFHSGMQKLDERAFKFRSHEIDRRDQTTSVRIGPDGHLYVSDVHGTIYRYQLGQDGKPVAMNAVVKMEGQQIIGLCFDPRATARNLILWVSHAKRNAGVWAGVISRLRLPPVGQAKDVVRQDVIVGLPCPEKLEHQPNQIAFGPDGKLYQSVGGVTTLGGTPNWGAEESLLSAAIIVADVNHPSFNGGKLPCDVKVAAPVNYDPRKPDAPVQLYATGLRNAVGICWHSSGHLFTATNANSIGSGATTPKAKGIPAITYTPHEALCRVVRGKYYGHPNPSRGEYVLLGGNPTAKNDPWEVPVYPVGVRPDPNFDPSLLYDLRPGGGNSPNGMCEYTAAGPLNGRLLVAYFSGGRCVQTFALDKQGRVIDERPLVDREGNVLRFNQPLDVCVHPQTGRIYLAVFGNWQGNAVGSGVEAHDGGVWMLEP